MKTHTYIIYFFLLTVFVFFCILLCCKLSVSRFITKFRVETRTLSVFLFCKGSEFRVRGRMMGDAEVGKGHDFSTVFFSSPSDSYNSARRS